MKRLFSLIAVLFLVILMPLLWLTVTESGLHWSLKLAKPYLPEQLTMNEVNGKLIGPITIKGIEYQQDGTHINADQIILDWKPAALLTASINISVLNIQSLKVVLPQSATDESARSKDLILPDIHLPWQVILKDAEINDLSIYQNDQNYAVKQIRLSATTHFSQVDLDKLSINADNFNLNVKGELNASRNYKHDLEIDWQSRLPTSTLIKGNGHLVGDTDTTRIKQKLSGPFQILLDGELNNLLKQLHWQAKINATEFDLEQLNVDWPALNGSLKLNATGDLTTATLSGTMNAEHGNLGHVDADFKLQRLHNNSIQIDHIKLLAPANDTQLHAIGQWVPGSRGGNIKLDMKWQNLRWPIQKPAWFNSARGNGSLAGTIDQYQFKLASDSPWPEVIPSAWEINAEGNREGLNIHSLSVTGLDGKAIATGQLNWLPALNWKSKVSISNINPAGLWPQWPGKLNGKMSSHGHVKNGKLIAEADVTQLKGQLRGYPAALRSRLSWHDKILNISLFDLSSGGSRLGLTGQAGEIIKLDWNLDSKNLAELYPQAKGQLKAKGQLTGSKLSQKIDASIFGRAISLPGYEIGAIDGTVAADLFHWQHIDIKLAAKSVKLHGYALQSLDINADSQRLLATAVSESATALLELKGKADPHGWRGHLEQAEIKSKRFANWQLANPVPVFISEKSLVIDPLCWHGSQDGSLCASVKRDDTAWHAAIEMKKFPVMFFNPWLPPDIKVDGVMDSKADFQFQSPDLLIGKAHIELPAGVINYPLLEGERERWEYRHGEMDISLDAQGLKANTEVVMINGDLFNAKMTLPGARPLAWKKHSQPIQASAHLNIQDLGLLEALIPEAQDFKGKATLNLSATGTLAQPKLSGSAQLLNGSLGIPRLGLNISQLSLKGQSDGLEKVDFTLDARSGEGTLSIQGHTTLNRTAGWPTEIGIKGNKFEVSRIPEAHVQVSPDIQVKIQKRTIDIKGNIHVPFAKLQPKDVTRAAHVSGDTVIIGDTQPTVDKWSISTRARLTLGERVTLYGFGFEGRLGGSLLLEDEPGQLTKATGEINIPEGRYRAYGQRLEVEQGRLLFAGGPLTNPGLDLRAVRRVEDVTAGLKVRGTLNQPQTELFSIPSMGQTEILSYLLLGRPIESASSEDGAMMTNAALALGLSGGDRIARMLGDQFGLDEMRIESTDSSQQTSLILGRYLSPKLYVSYGVGLIEAINTFTVRYQISDKWQLQGESGEHQGADILYTIKR
jgi:translocation and assembly module TamB